MLGAEEHISPLEAFSFTWKVGERWSQVSEQTVLTRCASYVQSIDREEVTLFVFGVDDGFNGKVIFGWN